MHSLEGYFEEEPWQLLTRLPGFAKDKKPLARSFLDRVNQEIFLPKALINQEYNMQSFLRKTVSMTVKNYVARVVRINSYLNRSPWPFQEFKLPCYQETSS